MSEGTQIGVERFALTETKPDKNNLDTQPDETEKNVEFPELEPGRAILNVATGAFHEMLHRIDGPTMLYEEKKTDYEESMAYKYDRVEGCDWGGVIEQYFISFVERTAARPNQHMEMMVPLKRPSDSEVTNLSPPQFQKSILTDENGYTAPLLIFERPQVAYEELAPGDSYELLGWYDPSEDASNRIKDESELTHKFPNLTNADYTSEMHHSIDVLNTSMTGELSPTDFISLEATEADSGYTGSATKTASKGDVHITTGMHYGDRRYFIDSPFDAKDIIKFASKSADTRWNNDAGEWTAVLRDEVLAELVSSLSDEFSVTLDTNAFKHVATSERKRVSEETIDTSAEDLIEIAFSKTTTTEVQTIPGINHTISKSFDASDVVILNPNADDNTASTSISHTPAENHFASINGDTTHFDCPQESASTLKSLRWSKVGYSWNGEHEHWEVNTDAIPAIIATFIEHGRPISATGSIIKQICETSEITEELDDENEPTDDISATLDEYLATPSKNIYEQENTSNKENSSDPKVIQSVTPSEPDRFTLQNIDLTINGTNSALTVDGFETLGEIPEELTHQWTSANSDDATYAWVNPKTDSRVEIREVDGWGTEYGIYTGDSDMDTEEHVVTLADESMIGMTALTHMKADTADIDE